MSGNANANSEAATGDRIERPRTSRYQDGERTRPAGCCQPIDRLRDTGRSVGSIQPSWIDSGKARCTISG